VKTKEEEDKHTLREEGIHEKWKKTPSAALVGGAGELNPQLDAKKTGIQKRCNEGREQGWGRQASPFSRGGR